MKNIEAPIDDGGNITLGSVGAISCAATAADHHSALAVLVRRDGEPLNRNDFSDALQRRRSRWPK